MGDTKIESAGQVLARQLSLVGESVDNASLFSAFEEGSTESSEPPVESPPTTGRIALVRMKTSAHYGTLCCSAYARCVAPIYYLSVAHVYLLGASVE
jgi:hypothetical protein